jgi:hypothetical protein
MHRSILAILFVASLVASAEAQGLIGKLAYPPPGTEFETTTETFRVDSVNGLEATATIKRTGRSIGIYGQFMSGTAVGNTANFDRKAVAAFWPLEIGKTLSMDTNREGGVWQMTWKVLRTETVKVPAGTFETFVVEINERGVGANTWRSTALKWYSPQIGLIVKQKMRVESQARDIDWELIKFTPPG